MSTVVAESLIGRERPRRYLPEPDSKSQRSQALKNGSTSVRSNGEPMGRAEAIRFRAAFDATVQYATPVFLFEFEFRTLKISVLAIIARALRVNIAFLSFLDAVFIISCT